MITSTGLNAATNTDIQARDVVKDKTALGKDDFMKLLLVELQHQDPTEPMDSEKILSQTSQLASLESAENTNKALEKLSAQLASTDQFAAVSAIGKRADLGNDKISHNEGSTSTFELYFPQSATNGTITINNLEGEVISTINLSEVEAGVNQFTWNGLSQNGDTIQSGLYSITSSYKTADGLEKQTKLGTYPIESIKFEDGKALAKLGSSYIPLKDIVEIY